MNVSDQNLRAKEGIITGVVGLIVNIILVILKLTAGIMANSVSILADAMNSLGDGTAAILTIGGFYIAQKPADREHPYGHERAEYISGLFTAIIILIVGLQFLKTSIEKILNPTTVYSSSLVIILLIISMLLKMFLGVYYYRKNKKLSTQSGVLNALMKDSLFDTLINAVIISSYLLEVNFGIYIDGYIGAFVALIIIYGGMTSIIESSNDLLGKRPNPELIDNMQKILDSFASIVGYHDLILHKYGPHKAFATVDIEMDSRLDLFTAHRIIDNIEYQFKKEFNIKLVCHLDPVVLHDDEQNSIYRVIKHTLKSYDKNFHFHDFRVDKLGEKRMLFFDVVVPDSCPLTDDELKNRITRDINNQLNQKFPMHIEFDRDYMLRG